MTHDLIDIGFIHVSGFELLFLISALVGAGLARRNLFAAWGDYHALGGITNGRRMIAIGQIAIETILGSVHALYIIVALVAVTIPASGNTTVVGVLIQAILVYASWGMTTISWISRRVGSYLNEHGLQPRDARGRFTS